MDVNIEIYVGDDNIYIARCPELEIYANGDSQGEAVSKLKKKIAAHYEQSDIFLDAKQDIDYTIHYYSTRYPRTH